MAGVYYPSSVQEIANAGVPKATKKFVAKAGRTNRPLQEWLKTKKKSGSWVGGTIPTYFKDRATNVSGQAFSGDDTINTAVKIKEGIKGDTYVARYVWNHAIVHDDLARAIGATILPNQNGANEMMNRVEQRTIEDDKILYNVLVEKNESFFDRVDETWNELTWRQGATAKDVVGINGLLPIALHGTVLGIDRAANPAVQHVVFAGNDANGTALGQGQLGARGTTGSGGTLLTQLSKFIRRLRQNAATCGLPRGRWKCFGGSGFFDKYKFQAGTHSGMSFNREAGGGGMINLVLADDDMKIAKDFDLDWDPTLDLLDTVASSEVGVGLSQISVTFSGGGGSGAVAVAYVTAAGALDKIVLLNPGTGFTSQPTAVLANVGSGTSATTSVTFYKGSSGTGAVVVDADDSRIGKLAAVSVTGGGSTYPTTSIAAPFTDRLYALYEPAWEYCIQKGLDFFMSIPPDSANARRTEQQVDHMGCLKPLAMTPNGVFLAD